MLRSFDLLGERDEQGPPLDNLVIDIRDVHHKLHVVVEVVAENAHDDVLAQIRSACQTPSTTPTSRVPCAPRRTRWGRSCTTAPCGESS